MKISESVKLLKALADSSRIKIIHSLFENAQYVEEIAERHDLAVSTVSFHLKKLEQADLVYKVKEQYYLVYHVKKQLFDLTLKDIISIKDDQKSAQEKRILKYKEKVISSFFKRGKLLRIPTQHKKRWVVYEKIAEKFSPDKKYQEAEINHIISEIYEDYCTIRRELIGENILQRNNEYYWVANKPTSHMPADKRGLKESFIESSTNSPTKKSSRVEKRAGVFRIINHTNQQALIDLSTNIDANLKRQKSQLAQGIHRNINLQADWNSRTPDDFSFEVLEEIKPEDSLTKGFRVTLKERTKAFQKQHQGKLY